MVGDRGWRKALVVGVFVGPLFIGFFIFVILPILASLGISFTQWDLVQSPTWAGFQNYIRLFQDPQFWGSLKHTLQFIVGYVPSVLILSLILALLLNQRIKGRAFFRGMYFLPVVSSWVAVSLIWEWVFNPVNGLLNYFLSWFGIHGPGWLQDPKWAMSAVVVTSVWKDIGFVTVIYLGGLQGISESYYEASKIDGATAAKRFWYVTLPLLTPTIFYVLIFSIINSFQVFDQVQVMTQGGPANATYVVMENIYNNAFRYNNMGYASAMSWILFLIIFVVTFVQMRYQRKWVNYET